MHERKTEMKWNQTVQKYVMHKKATWKENEEEEF
jgi:hypothetical protein